jgi:hypothetical protein
VLRHLHNAAVENRLRTMSLSDLRQRLDYHKAEADDARAESADSVAAD